MKQAKLTDLRRNLSSMLNAVNNDREPLVVTRRRGKPVVMISLEDYHALSAPPVRHASRVPTSTSVNSLLNSLVEADEISFIPNGLNDSEASGGK